ncbi:Subtilisin-like protease 6 [Rhizoctonia solani AG-1 IB]|uniref:Subtilisin-like protease 6 n=1 Tax=Thanatephorus cucumeris (strain AG1-IB / isolate 7/3/14) TaxID=1108050 RepID=M5BX54_THACB|nr:Subtilisin-like protease 6 [Rhizoctonia solani AG-1 IB]
MRLLRSSLGIYTAHSSFGGRARWGATFGGYANQDGNGHGTHTAGTAVGASYGVATSANIIAVKGELIHS